MTDFFYCTIFRNHILNVKKIAFKYRAYIQPSAHLEKSVQMPPRGSPENTNIFQNTKFIKTVQWHFSVYTTFLLNILSSGKLSVVVEIHVNFWRDVSVENDTAVISRRWLWKERWSMKSKIWEWLYEGY